MKILGIIPTYNERENIEAIIEAVLANTKLLHLDLLIVDDSSPDGTASLARKAAKKSSRVHVLERKTDKGFAKSYLDGFRWGLEQGYGVIFEMDADFSHPPELIPPIIAAMEKENCSFVIASRYVKGGGVKNWGFLRRLISLGGSLYARLVLGLPIKDLTGGFNFWRAEVLKSIGIDSIISNGYLFQIELKYRACKSPKNFTWLEYPFVFPDRRIGHSKMSKKIMLEALFKIWQLRFLKL